MMTTLNIPLLARLGPESNGMLLEPDEFDAIEDYDEDYSYELINGVVIVSPAPSESERGPNELLGHWLLSYRERDPAGSCVDMTLPEQYVAGTSNRRRSDRAIWIGLGRRPNPREDVPGIVVEFVSDSKRDRHRDYVLKRNEYIAAGVREYWVIDRFQRTLTVFGSEPQPRTVAESEKYSTDLLPGFELPFAELLAAADQWA